MAFRSLVLATGACIAAADAPVDEAWEAFKVSFPKTYNSDVEEAERKGIFTANYAHMQEHNKYDLDYKLGVNQFSDLTESEVKEIYTGASPPAIQTVPALGESQEVEELEDSVDWTSKGAVTSVKDQGSCGSCWSFSTTGVLEGTNQITTGHLVLLSEQQLVDCDTHDGNQGCSGGWPYNALDYIKAQGSCTEESYAYRGVGGRCASSSCSLGVPVGAVTGYHNVPKTSSGLMSAVMGQPVSVTVEVSGDFSRYSSGVLTGICSGSINHAVLAVGYGTMNGKSYWRVKNSWGSSWGDSGYVNIQRDASISQGAFCILQDAPVFPVMSGAVAV